MPVDTVRLDGVFRAYSNPTKNVFAHRHCFQVLRVNTPTVAAYMIYAFAFRYLSYKNRICEPMSQPLFFHEGNRTVAALLEICSCPDQALIESVRPSE